MAKRAAKTQSLADVSATISIEGARRKKHDEDYPMCARLSKARSDKAIIDAFLDWLNEDKKVVLASRSLGEYDGRFDPHPQSKDKLLMEYFEIDEVELEKERRKILAAQRRANGDLDADED